MGWVAAAAVIAIGAGLLIWLAAGRILEQADRLPSNTPAAFLTGNTHSSQSTIVVCVGDSITHGSISSNYVDALASRFGAGYTFVNAGINGDLAYNVVQRLDEIIACEPDVVTVLIGTNDANALTNRSNLRRYIREQHLPQAPTTAWYRENLVQIVSSLADDTNARVALLSIPPIGEDADHPAFQRSQAYGSIAEEVASAAEVDFLPLGESLIQFLRNHPGNPKISAAHKRSGVVKAVLRRFAFKQSYAAVSRANGHTLLIDHLHLNDAGAGMVANLIETYLREQSKRS